jgi:hypothetical protein
MLNVFISRGEFVVSKSIVAALLCIPFAANAQDLFVQYEGTVSSIERAPSAELPPFAIGDPIKGTLRIQPGRAPTDALQGDPHMGQYFGGFGVEFIKGPTHPAWGEPADSVTVYNDWQPPSPVAPLQDGIIMNDSWYAADDQFNLLLGLQGANTRLFRTDALEQSFDVESEPGISLWGYIERGLGEFRRVVNFTLSRLSVTPGSCRP